MTRLALALLALSAAAQPAPVFNTHRVVLDQEGKIVPWHGPAHKAYDHFLRLRWNFIQTKAPMSPGPAPRSNYPHYYFYCEYENTPGGLKLVNTPMNDVGEKIPQLGWNRRGFTTPTRATRA